VPPENHIQLAAFNFQTVSFLGFGSKSQNGPEKCAAAFHRSATYVRDRCSSASRRHDPAL
jgi:hypothetical protein